QDGLAKWMRITVPSIPAGQVARAFVRVEIAKSPVLPPSDPTQYVFAKSVSSDIRRYLGPSPYIESNHRQIKEAAESIRHDSDANAWTQVEDILLWVRERLEYRFDEDIRTCLHALKVGHGDCEEMTSLFIAVCRNRGIPARAVWVPHHTYPEFYLEDQDGNGHWFPCQAAGRYEFGSMHDVAPVLHKGDRFRIPGHREVVRYLQPTLRANRFVEPPALRWILQDIGSPSSIRERSETVPTASPER
ncbi:MAG: transglutaminase-like domain-containing protein, partial [Planctomycetota bacterium]